MYELRIIRPKETRIREYPNYVKARKAFWNAVRLNQGAHVTLTEMQSGKIVRVSHQTDEGSSNEN